MKIFEKFMNFAFFQKFDLIWWLLVITYMKRAFTKEQKKIRKTCFPVKDARKCKNKSLEYYFTSWKSYTAFERDLIDPWSFPYRKLIFEILLNAFEWNNRDNPQSKRVWSFINENENSKKRNTKGDIIWEKADAKNG